LRELNKAIESCTIDNIEPINQYLSDIDYILMPKKIVLQNSLPENIYSNQKSSSKYEIEEFNVFINCPIEIHLISVLWILEIGQKLDKELETDIHGYRLVRNIDGNIEENSFNLFEKYHERYMQFRDGALKKAIELHKEKLDTTIVNLDVKSFFYNIIFKFTEECSDFAETKNDHVLNKIMDEVHNKFKEVLKDKDIKSNTEKIIPIGLLSSSIVANYALKDFDREITTNVKPAFYSRYVDDMLIVLTNTELETNDTIKKILNSCIFKKINFSFIADKSNEINNIDENKNYKIRFKTGKNDFIFQNNKVKLFHFYKTDSVHLLEKFSKTITKNSSIFKLLPEDKDIFNTLEEASYNINYSSSINKISSINGNSLDILNISRNIVQMTKIVMNTNFSQEEINEYNIQLSNIFCGHNILDLQRLWEKIFTYLFVSNSKVEFIDFFKRIINIINNIEYKSNELINNLQSDLGEFLVNSIAMAISLYPNEFEEKILKKLESINTKNIDTKILEHLALTYILPRSRDIRKSNLTRHYMISSIPLINYCKSKHIVPYHSNTLSIDDFNFNIDDFKISFSPRFIHYHEISIFFHLKYLHNKMKPNEKKEYLNNQENFIYDKYNTFNKTPQVEKEYPSKEESEYTDMYYHDITNSPKKPTLNIALVNTKVNVVDSISSFEGKPKLYFQRLLDIFEVLNNAKKTSCDMVVFPEISIPYNWLKLIADFSKLNDIAIIFGMEHFSINKNVYNFSVAILPFQVNKHSNAFIHFNLKSHYSPSEILEIEGRHFKVPSTHKDGQIDIYRWKGSVFSIFNCYELTNIQARGKLVGENDFTIAIEYNSDTNYFSNIVGSIARDNHAYIVQVNSSQYGDSRITQPTVSATMDIVKIKGGKNTSIIAGEINISKLRAFQDKTHSLQMKEQSKDKYNSYKLTPPNFKISTYRQ